MFPVTNNVMGGVQMLLINLIPYIVKNKLASVRLYDYSTGLVKSELDRLNVTGYEFVNLDGSGWKIPNMGNEVFILTNGTFWFYPFFFQKKDNVFCVKWDVFYPYWQTLGKFKNINIPFLKEKSLSLLNEKSGVFFMEKNGLDFFHKNNLLMDKGLELVVPVPVNLKKVNLFLKNMINLSSEVNIAYIGRAVDWKMYPVRKIIKDLEAIGLNVNLHIYTNDTNVFSSFIGSVGKSIVIHYKEGFWGHKLEKDLIDSEINLGLSMGTAALDLARLGIPTLLADYSYSEFPDHYKYRYLFDSVVGSLGEEASEMSSYDLRLSLAEILLDFDAVKLSEKSISYVEENHSISVIASKLIKVAYGSSLSAGDISRNIFKVNFVFYTLRRLKRKQNPCYGWSII